MGKLLLRQRNLHKWKMSSTFIGLRVISLYLSKYEKKMLWCAILCLYNLLKILHDITKGMQNESVSFCGFNQFN